MKLKQKIKQQTIEDWKALPVSEFRYEKGIVSSRLKIPAVEIADEHPIKILAHKLSLASESASNNNKTQRIDMASREEQILKNGIQQFRKMLTPRDVLFQPKRSVFNRYNYENYHNYEYKNPYKPKRFSIDDKMQKPVKNNPLKGSSKNLQIVFCEHKYKDFVQRSNSQFRQFYQTSKEFPTVKSPKRTLRSTLRHQSQSKLYSTSTNFAPKKKTTLSNHLQQFNTLQKLSEYMQRQHKLNQKYLLHSTGDSSRTVLLDILVHRFVFLKKMKKRGRDLIFKIILGEQALKPLFKINIQDYIKFIQLFVSGDADCSIVAMFVFKFLFQDEERVNMQAALSSLDLLENTVKKHNIVENMLYDIFQKYEKPEHIYQAIKKNQHLQYAFMDLLTSQK